MDIDSGIYETELSFAENAMVISAFIWLQQHPDAQWMQSKTSKYIEQCIDKSLLDQLLDNYPNQVSFMLSWIKYYFLIYSSAML